MAGRTSALGIPKDESESLGARLEVAGDAVRVEGSGRSSCDRIESMAFYEGGAPLDFRRDQLAVDLRHSRPAPRLGSGEALGSPVVEPRWGG